jgi:nardilysin
VGCVRALSAAQVCAVESEFVGVRQNDDCRMAAIMSATAQQGHPLRTFMWGNKESLWARPLHAGTHIRDRIVAHWRNFYSASCMKLVVLGGESLDVLQQWITEDFEAVRCWGGAQMPVLQGQCSNACAASAATASRTVRVA